MKPRKPKGDFIEEPDEDDEDEEEFPIEWDPDVIPPEFKKEPKVEATKRKSKRPKGRKRSKGPHNAIIS